MKTIRTAPLDERIMALDLSLTHTGVVALKYDLSCNRYNVMLRDTITPKARSKGESDATWNRRRAAYFYDTMTDYIELIKPHVVVAEATKHAYPKRRTKDGGVRSTTRGEEYIAGYGLGRAAGWLDMVMVLSVIRSYEQMDAGLIKLRIAGNRTASKDAVRDFLKLTFGYDTDGWSEHEVDALACGIAWVRQRAGDERIAAARDTLVDEGVVPSSFRWPEG